MLLIRQTGSLVETWINVPETEKHSPWRAVVTLAAYRVHPQHTKGRAAPAATNMHLTCFMTCLGPPSETNRGRKAPAEGSWSHFSPGNRLQLKQITPLWPCLAGGTEGDKQLAHLMVCWGICLPWLLFLDGAYGQLNTLWTPTPRTLQHNPHGHDPSIPTACKTMFGHLLRARCSAAAPFPQL